jgi:hypothetical protein
MFRSITSYFLLKLVINFITSVHLLQLSIAKKSGQMNKYNHEKKKKINPATSFSVITLPGPSKAIIEIVASSYKLCSCVQTKLHLGFSNANV